MVADVAWIDDAKSDIAAWASCLDADADGQAIDWQWVRELDVLSGVGRLAGASDVPDLEQAVEALREDLHTRDRMEALLDRCSSVFMMDRERAISSYRLPRALAYANRRLCDEIDMIRAVGVSRGWWTIREEWRCGGRVPVLQGLGEVSVASIQDRSAELSQERARRRTSQMAARRRARSQPSYDLFATQSSDAKSSHAAQSQAEHSQTDRTMHRQAGGDWRDAYLPGRDVAEVMGIDIETTGVDPVRSYIIDVGFEYMDMSSDDMSAAPSLSDAVRPDAACRQYRYEQDSYRADGAYGQSRLSFGVPERLALVGNPFIAALTGIDVRERGQGYRLFDEWKQAQVGLLTRLEEQPYVAHNATFEHKFFMLNVAGYAESYRAGKITIIDTLPMSRRWDPGSVPDEEHPYGDNTLEGYARRQGALPEHDRERHLGLEDAHIMLLSMRHHLQVLKAQDAGPWGGCGRPGVGGKRCGSE